MNSLKLILTLLAFVFHSNLVFGAPLVLAWGDLVPAAGTGEPVLVGPDQRIYGLPDRKTFDGDDEDYAFLIESMEKLRYQQPPGARIRPELDGKHVKIPGYITPLSFNEKKLGEFLLVPYHGACIHLPPPPGNQIVFVDAASGIEEDRLYQPVWITGILRAKPVGTAVADVGYSIENASSERYDITKQQTE